MVQFYDSVQVFGMQSSNKEIFESVVNQSFDTICKGVKMTIFTYGQTSSGKTHTMKGSETDEGLIPRVLRKLFQTEDKLKRMIAVKMSYYEVYNETINDLLDSSKQNLDVREDKELGVFIKDITQVEVSSANAAMDQL